MAGPMNLSPPVALQPPAFLSDLAAILRQSRHPVYNAAGRHVGRYDTLDALCQGQWFVFGGETQPPVSQLYVMDFWGRIVPLSTQCVASAKATAKGSIVGKITHPQPVTVPSAARAVLDTNKAATGSAGPIDLDYISGPLPALTNAAGNADLVRLAPYAVAGGFALLGVVLLFSGGDAPRRRR